VSATEERLRAELEESFRNRAHLYRLLLEELAAELGPEAAERVLARAVERRGREAGAAFAGLGGARAVGEAFLAASPDGGRMYPTDVERHPDGITIKVRRCPLKDAWTGAGLPPARVAALCRLAGAFDKGLFEAAGVRFANETWREGGTGCCRIELRDL
jgi:hypothetical protein